MTIKQYEVYKFFLNNGLEGKFNRTIICNKTKSSTAAVKKSIVKMSKLKIIELGSLCCASKMQAYKLNQSIDVSVYDQGQFQDQIEPESEPEQSSKPIELSDFWLKTGLTVQKCNEWLKEIPGLTQELLQVQLEYGENTDLVINAKKGPVAYLYTCLKSSPLVKPSGYKTIEDKYAEITKQQIHEMLDNQKAFDLLNDLRRKEKEIADKESFFIFLSDNDSVSKAIDKIEKAFMTSNLKASVRLFRRDKKIDSRLEARLNALYLNPDPNHDI